MNLIKVFQAVIIIPFLFNFSILFVNWFPQRKPKIKLYLISHNYKKGPLSSGTAWMVKNQLNRHFDPSYDLWSMSCILCIPSRIPTDKLASPFNPSNINYTNRLFIPSCMFSISYCSLKFIFFPLFSN